MMEVLKEVGLGKKKLTWIAAIYSNPTAQVRVNGILSAPFPITNGTSQGCPLSLLIFDLTMELLLQRIRANAHIMGLQIGALSQQKVAAYADDLLFYVTHPTMALPNLIRELDH